MSESIFKKRSYNIFRHQRERAEKHQVELDYTLADLRQLVKAKLQTPCCYCGAKLLSESIFSLDHFTPIVRGGGWTLQNLAVCCMDCNTIKGNMTGEEFIAFLEFVARTIKQEALKNLLARIKAGSRVARG